MESYLFKADVETGPGFGGNQLLMNFKSVAAATERLMTRMRHGNIVRVKVATKCFS